MSYATITKLLHGDTLGYTYQCTTPILCRNQCNKICCFVGRLLNLPSGVTQHECGHCEAETLAQVQLEAWTYATLLRALGQGVHYFNKDVRDRWKLFACAHTWCVCIYHSNKVALTSRIVEITLRLSNNYSDLSPPCWQFVSRDSYILAPFHQQLVNSKAVILWKVMRCKKRKNR